MRLITVDFETHWASDYSLSKMSPLEYVMDERFELISLAIKVDSYPTDVFFGEAAIRKALASITDTISGGMVLAHNNSGFDSYVLAYRLGIKPRMWGCTLAMARPLHAKTCGVSLAALVKHYGLGVKDNAALINTRGKRLADFTKDELRDMAAYNKADVEQCHALFHKLKGHISSAEMWQIDTLIRMRTEPAFELDVPLLEKTAHEEAARKHDALLELSAKLNLDTFASDDEAVENVRAELASAPRFAALLESLGVEVPVKASPTNPETTIPALAKTDEEFLALQEHENELVAAAARARLDVKSTLLETRIQSWLRYGRAAGGMMPVALNYCGADTTGRDSGGDGLNQQNAPRVNPKNPKPTDALRMSLRAPKGKKVIVSDLSGIELRVNHFLWKVPSSMALYRASPDKADLYRAFGAQLYDKTPEEITGPERQMAKTATLSLGYGGGPGVFQRIVKLQGGINMPVHSEDGSLDADTVVQTWRRTYGEIVAGWRGVGSALTSIAAEREEAVDPWDLVHTTAMGFVLPSGRLIRYPDLREEDDGQWPDGRAKRSWVCGHGRHKMHVSGPAGTGHIVQALARDVICDGTLEYFKRTGLRPALRVHDELVYVVDEAVAEELLDELQAVLRTPPKWWKELVVWSEGDMADSYGGAK